MSSQLGVEKVELPLAPASVDPHPHTARHTAFASYLFALLLGLGVSLYMVPKRLILASDIRQHPVFGYDAAMNVVGQRYFTHDAWHWPLFMVKRLGTPEGTNVAFTDGIPLIELVVKLFRHFLPPDFHSVYLWLAICWLAQPIAAVFALRSAGERRLLPNVAVGIIAVSMPTLFFRFVHAALCSHFIILIALGLYFRIVRRPKASLLVAACGLMPAALLVNPYIMEMTIAVLVAAPLTLLIRRDRNWVPAAMGVGTGLAITAFAALLLGYGRAVPMAGFGTYSMNLLSPIYPTRAFFGQMIDATGGQYEGYQYLGVGVISLLLVADFCLSMQDRLALLRRHGGLVLACVGLTMLALSTKVYAGTRLLLDLPAPSWLMQLRGSGRLFWPVAYTAVIVGVLLVCRKLRAPWAAVLLLVLATLQYVESMPMRRFVRRTLQKKQNYTIDTAEFRGLLSTHSKLTVWPKFGCGADPRVPAFSDLYLLASEVAIPVNMTYVGRFAENLNCELPEFPLSVGPHELLVFVPQWNPGMVASVTDWRSICRESAPLVVCAQDLRDDKKLALPSLPFVPLGQKLSTAANAPGSEWLVSGWGAPESWGIWSTGKTSELAASFEKPVAGSLVLTVSASAVGGWPDRTQTITVVANGRTVATWNIKGGVESEYSAIIPLASSPARSCLIAFHVEHPVNLSREGRAPDPRDLGFALSGFRFDASRAP